MRKVWITKRKSKTKKTYIVSWYDANGKQRTKSLHSKAQADHYKKVMEAKLNFGAMGGETMGLSWKELTDEYKQFKKSQGLTDNSLLLITNTLKVFAEVNCTPRSSEINQKMIERYVAHITATKTRYGRDITPASINKNLRNLRTLILWGSHPSRKYIQTGIEMPFRKEITKPINNLSQAEIKALLEACTKPKYYMLVLLAVTTGLRVGDIARDAVRDRFNFKDNTWLTLSKKTGKEMYRPVPEWVMEIVKAQLELRPDKPLAVIPIHRIWKDIRQAAAKEIDSPKLRTLKLHDLRKTFASNMALAGVNQYVVQRLLEHSTPVLTNRVYTNVDAAVQDAINIGVPKLL